MEFRGVAENPLYPPLTIRKSSSLGVDQSGNALNVYVNAIQSRGPCVDDFQELQLVGSLVCGAKPSEHDQQRI